MHGCEVLLEPERDVRVGLDVRPGIDLAAEEGRERLGLRELADKLDLLDVGEAICGRRASSRCGAHRDKEDVVRTDVLLEVMRVNLGGSERVQRGRVNRAAREGPVERCAHGDVLCTGRGRVCRGTQRLA